MVTFWDKTSKTMSHVNNGFKGYQYYEFNYIKVTLLVESKFPICFPFLKNYNMKDLAGHGKEEEAAEEEKKKNSKPDAASFPSDGNAEVEKKADLFLFNENEFKDEKTGTSEQAGSLSNLLDLSNQQQVNIDSAATVRFKLWVLVD